MTSRDAIDALVDVIAERVVERLRSTTPTSAEHVYEDELVTALGSRDKARRLIKAGDIEGSVVGHRLIARRASLTAYIERCRVRPVRKVAAGAANDEAEDTLEDALGRHGARVIGRR